MKSLVAISHQAVIEETITEACSLLGDLSKLFKGKHVAIKPNDTWASPSDLTPCTQAEEIGLGTADLSNIEITGIPLLQASQIFSQKQNGL